MPSRQTTQLVSGVCRQPDTMPDPFFFSESHCHSCVWRRAGGPRRLCARPAGGMKEWTLVFIHLAHRLHICHETEHGRGGRGNVCEGSARYTRYGHATALYSPVASDHTHLSGVRSVHGRSTAGFFRFAHPRPPRWMDVVNAAGRWRFRLSATTAVAKNVASKAFEVRSSAPVASGLMERSNHSAQHPFLSLPQDCGQ